MESWSCSHYSWPFAASTRVAAVIAIDTQAKVLAEKANEIGLENVVYMKGLMVEDPSGEDSLDFALRHFGL